MQISIVKTPWWHSYDSLMLTDTPKQPSSETINTVRNWISENLHGRYYLPAPFLDFIEIPPWRHYPDERWDICKAQLAWNNGFIGRSFIDFGGNTGYYAFLAKASGADRSVLLDIDNCCTMFAAWLSELYGVKIEAIFDDMAQYDKFEHFDIAFCFSALPYVEQHRIPQLLTDWSQKVDILFIEMGDGGSYLDYADNEASQKELFEGTGWRAQKIDVVKASHTNTDRPIWMLEAKRLADYIYPFAHMDSSTQSRCYRDYKGLVLKDMTGGSVKRIQLEYEIQQKAYAAAPGQVAKPLDRIGNYILMEDLGTTQLVHNRDSVRKSADNLLEALRRAGVVHGDLDPPNLIIQDDVVKVIDFGWSELREDPQELDKKRLYRAIEQLP